MLTKTKQSLIHNRSHMSMTLVALYKWCYCFFCILPMANFLIILTTIILTSSLFFKKMIKSCLSGSNVRSAVFILSCFSFLHTNELNTGAMLSLLTDTHVAWVSSMEWVGKIKSVQRVAFLSLSLQPANNGGINGTQHNSPSFLDFFFLFKDDEYLSH